MDIMQEMVEADGQVHYWLGEMKEWEVDMARQLLREVEGVPAFVSMMVDQLLGRMKGKNQRRKPKCWVYSQVLDP